MRKAQRHRLSDLVTFVSGGTPSKQERAFWGGETPWVSAKDLKSLRISHSIDTLSQAGRQKSSLVPPGTLLVLVRGMSLFKKIPLGVSMRELAINQDIKGLVPKESVSPFFLAYSLLSMETELLQMVEAAGHGTGRLDTDSLKDLPVWIPERKMQDSIVDILSTWDAAIEKTEQLIWEQQIRLTGLILQLITKQKAADRNWKNVPLKDISETIHRQAEEGDYPLLTISSASGFVRQDEKYGRYMAGESAKSYTLLKKGEFAYNKGNSLRYEFGCIFQLQDYEAALVPFVYVCFKLKESICASYLRHLFSADYLKPQLRALVKTGVRNNGLLNIRPEEFLSTTVPIPPEREQQRIASILDTAEQELSALSKHLESLRLQKRGLMQKLLTGRCRLPADLPEAPR